MTEPIAKQDQPAAQLRLDTPLYFLLRALTASERAQMRAEGQDPDEAVLLYADRETGMVIAFTDRRMAEALQRLHGWEIEEMSLHEAVVWGEERGRGLLVRASAGDVEVVLDPRRHHSAE
jgi:hypothetical protein